MISLEEVIQLHNKSIQDFGGSYGIRDKNLLESAIARPYQSFDGTELYQTSFEKAAAIIESIVKNQPLVDGNKRAWVFLLVMFCFIARISRSMQVRKKLINL